MGDLVQLQILKELRLNVVEDQHVAPSYNFQSKDVHETELSKISSLSPCSSKKQCSKLNSKTKKLQCSDSGSDTGGESSLSSLSSWWPSRNK